MRGLCGRYFVQYPDLCDDSPMKVSLRAIELRSRRMLISLALPYSCVYTSSPVRKRGRERKEGRREGRREEGRARAQ